MISVGVLIGACAVELALALVWLHRRRRVLYRGQVNRWPLGKVGAP